MKVAVFGAGYAGLSLARTLERRLPPEADLVVVDEDDYHLVQHEIHRAVRRPDVADDLRVPLLDVLDRAELRQGRVDAVDPEAGTATFVDGSRLDYDVGAVCLGAATAFHALPGVEAHATPLKRLEHATEIRADFLDVADAGEGRVVVGGGGLSGVQVAGELAALADEEGVDEGVEVLLLEQLDRVAPNFPERFSVAVHDELRARGVEVRTGAGVAEADDDTLTLSDGTALAYDQLVWTGGIRGPDAMGGERPVVRDRLRLAGNTFVVGDAGRVVDADGGAVPASAQAAIRQADAAADNVCRLVEHELSDEGEFEPRLASYRFDSPGWLVSVGDGAVAQVGGAVLTGPAAVALKTTVGAGYLTTVGAVGKAVDLVREELGMAAPDRTEEPLEAVDGLADEDDGPIDLDVDGEE